MKISQNEIWKFGRTFLLAKFGSEKAKEGQKDIFRKPECCVILLLRSLKKQDKIMIT